MKKMLFYLFILFFSAAQLPFSLSLAQDGHGHGAATGAMKMDTREVLVEGVKAVFQIMSNKEHQKMLADMKMNETPEAGTTHNITVILVDEKNRKEITDAQINMKVIDPGGKDQIKSLKAEKEMKSYDGYFNLSQKGKYQVLISFKIGEKTRSAGIYYDVK